MNREIKFRGRHNLFSEWIYGSLLRVDDNYYIVQNDDVEVDGHHLVFITDVPMLVDKDTIGQFTGLRDKNGREIYEGDIIYQRTYFGNRPCVVRFEEGTFMVGYHEGSSTKHTPILVKNSGVVIGNIHDNPELIKEK